MPQCQLCKKEAFMPFKCSYCGQTFCTEHHLPEKHRCPGLPERDWKAYDIQKHGKKSPIQKKPLQPTTIRYNTDIFDSQVDTSTPKGKIRNRTSKSKNKDSYDEKSGEWKYSDQRRYAASTPRKTRGWLIAVLVICGLLGIFYVSDPESFTHNISIIIQKMPISTLDFENIIDSVKTSFENITKSISDILQNVTINIDSVLEPPNVYGNYSFGLVKSDEGVTVNSFGEYVVLINNANAKNPTFKQLKNFLEKDKTDSYTYDYVHTDVGERYGTAESNVNLTRMKNIVDGIEKMNRPRICSDFAEMLHNKAELSGFKCGYVILDLEGYTDPYNYGIPSDAGHALVVFNTTNKGLVYIDCTGGESNGPKNHDKIIRNFEIGSQYIAESLFPESGWESTYDSMGKITSIDEFWDGSWN
jgi:hypothetical protein